jgi:hypothetical protein
MQSGRRRNIDSKYAGIKGQGVGFVFWLLVFAFTLMGCSFRLTRKLARHRACAKN